MDLVGGFFQIVNLLTLAIVAVGVFAFIDALVRPAAAFVAANKLTKPAWAAIVGVSALALLYRGVNSIFGLAAIVGIMVYMVDVRPAVRGLTGGGGSSSGPYGPW